MLLYFFMCDNLSISLILRKKILNLSKNVSIPGVDEEKPKEGGGGGGEGVHAICYEVMSKFFILVLRKIFSDFYLISFLFTYYLTIRNIFVQSLLE